MNPPLLYDALTPGWNGSLQARARSAPRDNYLLLCAGFLVLAVLGVGAAFWGGSFEQIAFVWVLLLFTTVVAGLIVRRWRQNRLDWFEPAVFLPAIYLLFFGYAGLPYVLDPAQLHPFLQGDQKWLTRALLLVLLGVLAFWVGYFGRIGLALHQLTYRPAREWLRSQATIRTGVVVGLYLVGLLARLLMLRQGLYGYLRDSEAYASLPYAEFLVRVEGCTDYAVVLAWLDRYSHPHLGSRRFLAPALLVSELLWGFFSGMKLNVILPLLFVAMVYTYKRRRLPTRYLATAFLLLVLIYPVNTVYRQMITSGALQVRSPMDMISTTPIILDELLMQYDDPNLYLGTGYASAWKRASMIENYALLLKYLDQTGAYWHGRYVWMLPALITVPRVVWPDKPVFNMGYWFAINVYGQDPHVRSSTAITYPGDLYLQFGLPSLLIGMFLTGIALRWVYERYGREGTSCSLFFYIFLLYQLVEYESDVAFKVASTVRVFLIILGLSFLVFRFPRRTLTWAERERTELE